MKIDYLKINGFGKLNHKELKLNKNINIIYGKNEAGKSTILNFITSMFYGVSKTKDGKDISNYEKYIPWKTEEFSGKIEYTLDNGKNYEVYRDFKKKTPIIYNEKNQDISLDFNMDKNKGIDFIFEQTGISEETFKNTVITAQNEIKISKNIQNTLVQKMSNIVSSGNENISFKKTMDKINKLQNENIGTDRTLSKPVNIVNQKIESLIKEKEELEEYKTILESSIGELDYVQKSETEEEAKLELFRKIKDNLEEYKLKSAEIDIVKKIKDDYEEKIEQLENKIDKKAKKQIINEKKSFLQFYILIIMFLIFSIVIFILKLHIALPVTFLIVSILLGIVTFIKSSKFKKDKKSKINEIEELESRITQEISILENNINEQENKIRTKEEQLEQNKLENNNKLKNEFENRIDYNFLDMVFDMHLEEIMVSIANKEDRLNALKLESQTKNNEKIQMQEKIDNLVKIEEELENLVQERNNLLKLNNSFNIAKECMEEAYQKVRNNVSPEFTDKLCNMISKILSGNYENINFNDETGLTVEIEDGRYIPVERLSQGTIDQMYLALRLSSIEVISKENLPIILDETFAYFDDDRLKNILKFINDYYENKQVIIFTCSNREKDMLNKLKIEYNEILI